MTCVDELGEILNQLLPKNSIEKSFNEMKALKSLLSQSCVGFGI